VLPQKVNTESQKIWGRRVYKGYNLQNQPSNIREAALGKCMKYDIRTSVYAVYCELMKEIGLTEQYIETTELCNYVRHSRAIRRKLVKDCIVYTSTDAMTPQQKEKWCVKKLIKPAITALGFGAKLNENKGYVDQYGSYQVTAMGDILYQNLDRKSFVNHSTIQQMKAELKDLRDLLKVCKDEFLANKTEKELPEQLYHKNGRLNLNVFTAWVYQNMETIIMDKIYAYMQENYGIEPILKVHDGFYTKHPIPIAEINSEIRKQLGLKYIYLDCEAVKLVIDRNPQSNIQHTARISAEEDTATQYQEKRYGD